METQSKTENKNKIGNKKNSEIKPAKIELNRMQPKHCELATKLVR